jgi:hypothetical protein
MQKQIGEAVRKSVENARDAARAARDAARAQRDAARAGQDQGGPVIVGGPGSTSVPPMLPVDVKDLAQNVSYAFFFTVAVIAIGVPIVRAIGRRYFAAPQINAVQVPQQLTEQIQRIEHAVESMAIEVERISESQRFLMKLQTGKPEQAALPRQGS